MHQSSLLRMKWFRETFIKDDSTNKVLDVGSYDVNGSYRQFFEGDLFEYTGLDMEPGPNVDLVPANAYNWNEIRSGSYDVVISGQAFEHIEFFWLTMSEMVRVLKKDGIICIIAPSGFGEHRYPVDCWRFFTDGLVALARYTSIDIIHAHTNCALPPPKTDLTWISENEADSMIIARKPYDGPTRLVDTQRYTCIPANHKELGQHMIRANQTLNGNH
jgi:SAM-dependent methyltransferase